jgi:uncharacterized protein YcgL (UPF0745 family)
VSKDIFHGDAALCCKPRCDGVVCSIPVGFRQKLSALQAACYVTFPSDAGREGIYRYVSKEDAQNAIPVHATEGFDPVAFGRQLALEDRQKLKDAIDRWRGIQQRVMGGSLLPEGSSSWH